MDWTGHGIGAAGHICGSRVSAGALSCCPDFVGVWESIIWAEEF